MLFFSPLLSLVPTSRSLNQKPAFKIFQFFYKYTFSLFQFERWAGSALPWFSAAPPWPAGVPGLQRPQCDDQTTPGYWSGELATNQRPIMICVDQSEAIYNVCLFSIENYFDQNRLLPYTHRRSLLFAQILSRHLRNNNCFFWAILSKNPL